MMKNRVTIFENTFDSKSWQTFECGNISQFLKDHYDKWPTNARLYNNYVCESCNVTPHDEGSVARLDKLSGHFFVVVYPESLLTVLVIVSVALAAISVILSFLLRPSLPENQQNQSPNNSLTQRENKERLGGRIPDIYGSLWAYPDLIAYPYRIFVSNKEVEHMFMCLGRGEYDITNLNTDIRDDVTPLVEIDGANCEVYGPNTSPNSGDVPQYSIGKPINTPVKCVKPYLSVNGQTLRAPNANSLKSCNNIRFKEDGTIEGTGDIDFTNYFTAGTESNEKYLIISNSGDYDGTYLILAVDKQLITLSNPAGVNANWNDIDIATEWATLTTPVLTNSGDNWEGVFKIQDNTVTEIWCNFVAAQGSYIVDSSGNQRAMDVAIQIEVKSLDSAGEVQGSAIYYTVLLNGSKDFKTQCGATIKAVLPFAGSCQVRARRVTNTCLINGWSVSDEIQWRDLYAISPIIETDFGNVTTVQTVTWPTPQALTLKKRKLNILVNRKLNILPTIATTVIKHGADHQHVTLNGTIAGNTLLVSTASGSTNAATLSDNQSNVYTKLGPEVKSDSGVLQLYIAKDILGGNVTLTTEYNSYLQVIEMADFDDDGSPVFSSAVLNNPSSTFNVPVGPIEAAQPSLLLAVCEYFYAGTPASFDATPEGWINVAGLDSFNYRIGLGSYDYTFSGTKNNATKFEFLLIAIPLKYTTSSSIATKNAADIFCAMALDPYIGRRIESEINREEIYSVLGSAGEVEEYFGTALCAQFCYTFDDSKVSFEEMIAQLAQAVFCTAYRRGNILSVLFEKLTNDSTILFNHRNKIPNTETRTVTFGNASENDGIDLEYTEPNAESAQNIDSIYTLHFPQNESAISPRKITAMGVRNLVQAWMLGFRMYNKLLYQNTAVQFETTSEAALSIINERILIADNTKSDTQDGEIIDQNGLEIELSQPVVFVGGRTYTIFIQHYDETIESIAITAGSADNKVVLSQAPSMPLVIESEKYARTTYIIVDNTTQPSAAFLLQEKEAKNGGQYGLKAINYDVRYYEHDQDYVNDLIDVIMPNGAHVGGFPKQAQITVIVDAKCKPWNPAHNPTYSYGKNQGKEPAFVTIQASQGDSVIISSTPGWIINVDRLNGHVWVDAVGELDHITGQTSDGDNGHFPTYYATSPALGHGGLMGAWAHYNSGNNHFEVIQPLAIGYGGTYVVPSGGVTHLLLGINDTIHSDNDREFQVTVIQIGAAAGDAAAVETTPDTTIVNPDETIITFTVNGE
jgi:hypothetical protein